MAGVTGVSVGHAELATLKHLALLGALDGEEKFSCSSLSERLDTSTQTASRRLQSLDGVGFVERDVVSDGQWITITDEGESALQREYADYRRIFEGESAVELHGAVTSGMGEGRHYISLPGYMEQFVDRLGYEPFKGTLNVDLDEASVRTRARLSSFDPITIDGWEGDERTYGPAYCYPATVENDDGDRYEEAHVITPERTHHDEDQLEVIAPAKLRDDLALDDGSEVIVHVSEQ
jgi:riboflavin kinase